VIREIRGKRRKKHSKLAKQAKCSKEWRLPAGRQGFKMFLAFL